MQISLAAKIEALSYEVQLFSISSPSSFDFCCICIKVFELQALELSFLTAHLLWNAH